MSAAAMMLLLSVVSDPIGVVRYARGPVTIGGEEAKSGTLIERGALVECGPDGYAEIALHSAVRVRISATTRVQIEEHAVKLVMGRVWIQATQRTVLFEMPGVRADISGRSAVIAEHARLGGSALAVRAGTATVLAGEERAIVNEREIAVIDERGPYAVNAGASPAAARLGAEPSRLRVRTGGTGLGELATREAQDALGDLLGLNAFLLAHAQTVELGSSPLRGVQDIVRTDAELNGADAGPGGILVEGALRSPPFFEEEVPPKGPNVRVEVTFGDE